jgi:hypothetical protein
MEDGMLRRLLDNLLTTIYSLSSICSFYGVWVLQVSILRRLYL